MQQAGQVCGSRGFHAHSRARGPMRVTIVDARVAADIDHGVRLVND